ncbi:MAG TPA: hypothetical protein ENH82_14140 [bacterium]|nr:hypothetical protein [bacterium]
MIVTKNGITIDTEVDYEEYPEPTIVLYKGDIYDEEIGLSQMGKELFRRFLSEPETNVLVSIVLWTKKVNPFNSGKEKEYP